MFNEVIIEDEFPEYYIKIEARYVGYDLIRPDIFIGVDSKIQYYIRKKDIPDDLWLHYKVRKDGIRDIESILTDLYFDSNGRIISNANIDLFIKFDTKSDMLKWKLRNG